MRCDMPVVCEVVYWSIFVSWSVKIIWFSHSLCKRKRYDNRSLQKISAFTKVMLNVSVHQSTVSRGGGA